MIEACQRLLWAILSRLRRSERLWELIEHTGIAVFVGPNGSGKSLAAVASVLPVLRGVPWSCDQLAHHHNETLRRHVDACADGCDRDTSRPIALCEEGVVLAAESCSGLRRVYSTVPLLDDRGEPHELYVPLVDFRQLVTIEHAEVVFDEVAGVADASDASHSMPVQVTNWLHQLRKRDNRLRVTTPAYGRCAKQIRQVAQLVVDARSFFPEPSSTGRLWRPRRGMLFRAFDAWEFEDYTRTTGERVKARAGAAFWRPGSEASRRYDTLSATNALGHVMDGGMCAICGGSRSRPRCACPREFDEIPMDELVVEEHVTGAGARTRTARRLEDDEAPEVESLETVLPPVVRRYLPVRDVSPS